MFGVRLGPPWLLRSPMAPLCRATSRHTRKNSTPLLRLHRRHRPPPTCLSPFLACQLFPSPSSTPAAHRPRSAVASEARRRRRELVGQLPILQSTSRRPLGLLSQLPSTSTLVLVLLSARFGQLPQHAIQLTHCTCIFTLRPCFLALCELAVSITLR